MAEHRRLTAATGIQVFFCDPRSPWQRPGCENVNGLIREFLPKGHPLDDVGHAHLNRIAYMLNTRPRKVLNWRTPNDIWKAMGKGATFEQAIHQPIMNDGGALESIRIDDALERELTQAALAANRPTGDIAHEALRRQLALGRFRSVHNEVMPLAEQNGFLTDEDVFKVFLDANVVVSALATRGLCADLYERLLTKHEVVIGGPVIVEVLDILQRKFRANRDLLIKVEAELRLLRVIPARAAAPALPICDVDAPWIIVCALHAGVDCFVTGDAELLTLEMVDKLPIISSRVCWEKIEQLSRLPLSPATSLNT